MLKAIILLSCTTVFAEVNEKVKTDDHKRSYKIRYGNPEERGPYPEGDLLIPISKNGIKAETYRWNNARIPYEIQSGFSKLN